MVSNKMSRRTMCACLAALPLAAACTESESQTTVAVGPDPDFAGCQQGCGFNEPYEESEVVSQPGASVGDLARCPVSDAVFRVRDDQPTVEHAGSSFYVCCSSCAERFAEEPARFAAPRS